MVTVNENGKKIKQKNKTTLNIYGKAEHFFVLFFVVVLHHYKVKRPELNMFYGGGN